MTKLKSRCTSSAAAFFCYQVRERKPSLHILSLRAAPNCHETDRFTFLSHFHKHMRSTLFAFICALFLLNGCAQVKSISDSLTNLQRLQFKLKNVSNFKLADVEIGEKTSLSDFSITDGLALLNAYKSKSLPAMFFLNVDVKNPNDGTGSSKSASATLKGLDFRLLIDDKQTLAGDIGQPFQIPASGSATTVPVVIYMDLMDYFKDKTYNEVLQLALAIGGREGSAGRLTLDVKPTVDTPLGAITYPSRIKVIDKEFRN